MKVTLGLVVFAAGSLLSVPLPWQPNPRERTAAALEAWEAGDYRAAAGFLEEALELEPEAPRVRFNAGAGRLAAGQSLEAARLLVETAGEIEGDLAPDLFYNLGNAFLEVGESAAAVEAYKESLRRDPAHSAAKHNLELALREDAAQPSGGAGQGEGSEGGENGGEGSPQPGSDGGGEPGLPEAPQPDQEDGPPSPGDDDAPEPLPGFQTQEDMTAEQAAALLEAVESLESQQRRERAAEIRRQRAQAAGLEKDW